jgi:hypothetical protein
MDLLAGDDTPLDHLALGDALAQVGQRELGHGPLQ